MYIDKQDYSKLSNFKIAKIIFLKSLPITLSATIIPLTLFIDSILIINLLTGVGFSVSVATSLFGIQTGVVNSLITLPMIIAIAISTAILPSIVASNTLKNAEEINFKTSLAIKIVWIISLPCFIGFLLLATDITSVLYSGGLNSGQFDEIAVASSLIKIVAVSIIYHSFLRIFTSILHALNKSFTVVKHLILASVVKIALTVLLVSSQAFNIYGASVASAVSYAIACLLTLISLKKFISVTFSFKTFVINPLIASIFLVATILLGKKILSNFLSEAYATLITIGLSAIVYIVAIGVLKVFNKDELNYIPFFKKIKKLFTKKVRL